MNGSEGITRWELLDLVRENPQEYLDTTTLSSLNHLYYKVLLHEGPVKLRLCKEDFDITLFSHWLMQRLRLTGKTPLGIWYPLSANAWWIVETHANDDHEAFKCFFTLLDEFRSLEKRLVAEVAFSEGTRPCPVAFGGGLPKHVKGMKIVWLAPSPTHCLYYILHTCYSPVTEDLELTSPTVKSILSWTESACSIPRNEWVIHDPEALKTRLGRYLCSWLPWKRPKLL